MKSSKKLFFTTPIPTSVNITIKKEVNPKRRAVSPIFNWVWYLKIKAKWFYYRLWSTELFLIEAKTKSVFITVNITWNFASNFRKPSSFYTSFG